MRHLVGWLAFALAGLAPVGSAAEDIANAQPNLEAVAQAEAQRADGVRARQYAADASLTAQVVEPSARTRSWYVPGSTSCTAGFAEPYSHDSL